MTISVAETYWDRMLASATPSAAMPQRITKNRFSRMFSTPETVRYSSGRRVSPLALITPLPKLNTPSAGIPSA